MSNQNQGIRAMALGLSLTGLLTLGARAQEQPTTASAAAVDRARIERYVQVLQGELKVAEARDASVTARLVALDEEIEQRIDRIVELLSAVRDSAEGSSIRMRKAKENALAGLKASAAYYADQRDRRIKEMGNPYARKDETMLAREVAALNARIEKRVEQTLDIAVSLAQHVEAPVERYRDTETDYTIKTQEQRKLDRDVSQSAKLKAEVLADLRASIEKLTRDAASREAQLDRMPDSEAKEQLKKEIAVTRQTIAARHGQIQELLAAPKPATRPVSSRAAFEMDKMLDDMALDLKADFARFKSLVSELDAARVRVKPLKDQLEKAQALLEAAPDAQTPAQAD